MAQADDRLKLAACMYVLHLTWTRLGGYLVSHVGLTQTRTQIRVSESCYLQLPFSDETMFFRSMILHRPSLLRTIGPTRRPARDFERAPCWFQFLNSVLHFRYLMSEH
jgi:hypothetical protein